MIKHPEPMSVHEIFEECALVNSMDFNNLTDLEKVATVHNTHSGDTVWDFKNNSNVCGILGRGFATAAVQVGASTVNRLEIIGPGRIFGYTDSLGLVPQTVKVQALSGTSLMLFPQKAAADLFQKSPFLLEVLCDLDQRAHTELSISKALVSGNNQRRIAYALVLLAQSFGEQTALGIRIKIPFSRQTLGELTDMTTEAAIRVMSRWSKDDIICTIHKYVTIKDIEAIESTAQKKIQLPQLSA